VKAAHIVEDDEIRKGAAYIDAHAVRHS